MRRRKPCLRQSTKTWARYAAFFFFQVPSGVMISRPSAHRINLLHSSRSRVSLVIRSMLSVIHFVMLLLYDRRLWSSSPSLPACLITEKHFSNAPAPPPLSDIKCCTMVPFFLSRCPTCYTVKNCPSFIYLITNLTGIDWIRNLEPGLLWCLGNIVSFQVPINFVHHSGRH